MEKYKQIQLIHQQLAKYNIPHTFSRLYDGYKILFANGVDMVQHCGSYGAHFGCVEPAGFGAEYDYTPISYIAALNLIKQTFKISEDITI